MGELPEEMGSSRHHFKKLIVEKVEKSGETGRRHANRFAPTRGRLLGKGDKRLWPERKVGGALVRLAGVGAGGGEALGGGAGMFGGKLRSFRRMKLGWDIMV